MTAKEIFNSLEATWADMVKAGFVRGYDAEKLSIFALDMRSYKKLSKSKT
jgi:hypothetical protein